MIEQSYLHPESEDIIQQTLEIMSYSSTAKAILEELSPKITVIKGIQPQAYVYEDKIIYLRVPALQHQGTLEQAIDLGGALIEAMENRLRPQIEPDHIEDDETLRQQHLCNVSIIIRSFKIAEELEENGFSAIKELRLMGLGKIYQAYKAGAGEEECANIYWNMFDTDER